MRVRRTRSGLVEVRLDEIEAQVVHDLVSQVKALLTEEPEVGLDPLDALLDVRPRERPHDPALARLLPDGSSAPRGPRLRDEALMA